MSAAAKFSQEIGLDFEQLKSESKAEAKTDIVLAHRANVVNNHKNMPLHGQYFRELDAPYINKRLSLAWMHKSGLNGAAEATTFAIQEQAITTRYIEINIHNAYNIDDKCRLCGEFTETIHHIVSGCPTLAPTKYTWRHNNVAKLLYIRLATKFQLLQEKALWYSYDPPPVLENDNAKILWNFKVFLTILAVFFLSMVSLNTMTIL